MEVQRAKGPNPANERDPIFERGSTTTYSSFRKGTYCKPWSSEGRKIWIIEKETRMGILFLQHTFIQCLNVMIVCCFPTETDMFFLAISMVGTDFSMICQLFPLRARSEIKVSDNNSYAYVYKTSCIEAKHCSLLFYKMLFVLIALILNFQNKFKKEERENSWRIDKAFSKYSVRQY